MVQIRQQIVPQANRHATYGTGNPKKKLVVHQTGNIRSGANAQMHADLQSRGWRNASWHIQSDDKEIIQSWPFEYRLWHASTGNMANGGNNVGIGWEICINSDGDYLKSLEVAAKGIAKVMKQEGIPMSGLTTHNAEDPNNKWCPAQILSGKDGVNWSDFRAMVQAEMDGKPVKPSTAKPQPVAPKPVTGKQILHLPASAKTWRVYKPNGPYTKGNEIHLLTPSAYGGIDYEIKGNPAKDVYLIDTGVKGRVAIYAGVGTGAKITGSKAPVAKPKQMAKSGIERKYKESGTFYPNDTIIVRDDPSTGANIIARYYKGEKVTYHTVHLKNGYVWLQYNRSNGKQGYIPCRTYSNGKYGTLWGIIK